LPPGPPLFPYSPLFRAGGAAWYCDQNIEGPGVADTVFAGYLQAQWIVALCRLLERLCQLRRRYGAIGIEEQIHPEARAEQDEGDQHQYQILIPTAAYDQPALGGRGEDQHGNRGNQKDDHPVPQGDIDQQQIGVEDEQEWQDGGANTEIERLNPGAYRV